MECPYCGKEMEKGYIQSRDVLSWSRKKVLIAALSGLVADTTLSYTVIGYRCSTCKKILIDYEEDDRSTLIESDDGSTDKYDE